MGNPVVHFEIGGRDSSKSKEFYATLFGWSIEEMGPAMMVSTGADSGIGGHLSALGHEPHNYVTIYAQVDDIPATLEKAKSLGGDVMVPETEVPGMGYFAWMTDIDGNIIGLWKPNPQA